MANTQDYTHIENKHNRFAAKPHEPSCLCGARQKQVHPLVGRRNYIFFFNVPISSSFFFFLFLSFSFFFLTPFFILTIVEQPHTIHYPKKLYRSSVNNIFSLLFLAAWVLALCKTAKRFVGLSTFGKEKKHKAPQRTEQDGGLVTIREKHQCLL